MKTPLTQIINTIYKKCDFQISAFETEAESKEYNACRFRLNGLNIVCRNGKITPKKIGQFVTFWKRNKSGVTQPMHENDPLDFYVINVSSANKQGQFIIPKHALIDKGILSTLNKNGKRGFRVYPPWDIVNNKQAEKTQKWQLNFFVEMASNTNCEKVRSLYFKE